MAPSDSGIYNAIVTGTKAALTEHMKPYDKKLDELNNTVYGPKEDQSNGHTFRLLTVEKISSRLLWVVSIFAAACIVAAVNTWVSNNFSNNPAPVAEKTPAKAKP